MATKPYLIVESESDAVTLIFNKFGDPDVDYYRIYAGKEPQPFTLFDTSKTTLKKLVDFEKDNQYYGQFSAGNLCFPAAGGARGAFPSRRVT